MTTAAIADEMLMVGLVDQQHDQVDQTRPKDDRPEPNQQEAVVKPAAGSVRSRRHELTILSLFAGVQLTWMAAIGYGVLYLLS